MMGNYYFVMVGHHDNPLFEMEFSPAGKETQKESFVDAKNLAIALNGLKDIEDNKEDHSYLNQFIAHAALDLIDEHSWRNSSMHLKIIDKFNDWYVSGFITASRIRFVLLHDIKNDDGIKSFFSEMYEMYIKYCINPFYAQNTPIISPAFEKKAAFYGRKFLVG